MKRWRAFGPMEGGPHYGWTQILVDFGPAAHTHPHGPTHSDLIAYVQDHADAEAIVAAHNAQVAS